jgi:hypothetical protein
MKFNMWGCIQKFPDWVDNEMYACNNKHSLRSNTEGYGGKTHYTDSQNNNTTALLLFISLSTQSGNFWIYPRMFRQFCSKQSLALSFSCGRREEWFIYLFVSEKLRRKCLPNILAGLLGKTVTGYGSYVFHYDPETKCQSPSLKIISTNFRIKT